MDEFHFRPGFLCALHGGFQHLRGVFVLSRRTVDKDCSHDFRNICECKITTFFGNMQVFGRKAMAKST